MRHLLQIDDVGATADILAERERERRFDRIVLVRAKDFREIDDLAIDVRNLDADHRLAGDHVDHAHAHHRQAARDVLVETRKLAALDPRGGLQLKASDHRAGIHANHFSFDAEITQLQF